MPKRPESISRARIRLLVGLAFVIAGNGMLLVLFGIRAKEAGFGVVVIRMILGGYYVGFLIGSLTAPSLVKRFGTSQVFTGLCLVASAVAFAPPTFVSEPFWLFLRICMGFSFASMYVVIESWLNRTTVNDRRARILGLYLVIVMASFAIGTLLLLLTGTKGTAPFMYATGISLFGTAVSVLLPDPPAVEEAGTQTEVGFGELIRRAPLGTSTAFLCAVANSAFVSSLALWAKHNNFSEASLVVFATCGSLGPLAFQFPFSHWSDRTSRMRVMFVVTVGAAIAAFVGAFGPHRGNVPMVGAFVLGGLSYTLYSLFGAETNDHLHADEMPSGAGWLMLLTGFGSIVGTVLIGVGAWAFGEDAFFFIVAGAHLGVGVIILVLRARPRSEMRVTIRPSVGN